MEQFVLVPTSVHNQILINQPVTNRELPKYQPSQNSTYQIGSLKKETNKKISKTDSLVHKDLSGPGIELPNSKTIILDVVETGFFLLDFAQQLRHKNADVSDIYFTLLDAAGISPILIVNQNARATEKGIRVPFKISTSESAKALYKVWCCLGVSAQLSES